MVRLSPSVRTGVRQGEESEQRSEPSAHPPQARSTNGFGTAFLRGGIILLCVALFFGVGWCVLYYLPTIGALTGESLALAVGSFMGYVAGYLAKQVDYLFPQND